MQDPIASLQTQIDSLRMKIEDLQQHGMLHSYKGSDPLYGLWIRNRPDIPFGVTPDGGIAVWLLANGAFGRGDILEASGGMGVKQVDANDDMPIGIAYTAAKAGDYLWVVHAGIAYVRFKGGVTPTSGHVATVSDEAGHADSSASLPAVAIHNREIGHVLETGVAGGLARCLLHWN